ncbi:ribose 5-phosphate isomerase B [Natranaerobius trueperi]|uniref:Ribose 5-phosphate isomerase B n=1 Tax=Natranaerobius trueperi TaxID=759412 RepID=A0A226C088_9FIRM|nr:ribose 5-phosphate isomerase B [Natranaerobius trueperi]OWZ84591.1 ribose 5-phosphate isomerase B [Natranaerobius trueperi]
MTKVIGVASDHGGYNLKQKVIDHLKDKGYQINDLGTYGLESVDYPDFAVKLADSIKEGEASLGILVCGTGIGISLSANKVPGIRAALCHDTFSAEMARRHNNANVLAMGERVIGSGLALKVVDTFLESEFDGGRHEKRVNKILEIEKKHKNF